MLSSRGLESDLALLEEPEDRPDELTLEQRIASRQVLPSTRFRATYVMAGGWCQTWVRAIT
jgi:hypothetical protein